MATWYVVWTGPECTRWFASSLKREKAQKWHDDLLAKGAEAEIEEQEADAEEFSEDEVTV